MTWKAFEKEQEPGKPEPRSVHWLKDKEKLPRVLSEYPQLPARIFTYNWESRTTRDASGDYFKTHATTMVQKVEEIRREVCFHSLLLC